MRITWVLSLQERERRFTKIKAKSDGAHKSTKLSIGRSLNPCFTIEEKSLLEDVNTNFEYPGLRNFSSMTAVQLSTGWNILSARKDWMRKPGKRWESPCFKTTQRLWCQSFRNSKKFPLQTFIIYATTRVMWWISSVPASPLSFPPLTVMTASDPTWTQFNFRYQLKSICYPADGLLW